MTNRLEQQIEPVTRHPTQIKGNCPTCGTTPAPSQQYSQDRQWHYPANAQNQHSELADIERAREIAISFLSEPCGDLTGPIIRSGKMDNHVWVRIALAALTQGKPDANRPQYLADALECDKQRDAGDVTA